MYDFDWLNSSMIVLRWCNNKDDGTILHLNSIYPNEGYVCLCKLLIKSYVIM